MLSEAFFNAINSHYQEQQPFVMYRLPNEKTIKGLLQQNDTLFTVKSYNESGFVFAPFDSTKDPVLIPLEESSVLTTDYKSERITEKNSVSESESTNARTSHEQLIKKGLIDLESGALTKVVLSRVEEHALQDFNLITIFNTLLNLYKTAFVYCWYHPKVGLWLGATPETLLSLSNNLLKTMSLAGTQPAEDFAHVFWGDKEIEEQQYVTDYIIESILPFSDSIRVTLADTIQAGDLLHLQSQIEADLSKEGHNLKALITSLHPTPAICGIPRTVAKEFIISNEGYNREFYSGFLGELNYKKTASRNNRSRNVENTAYRSITNTTNLFVNLRCMQINNLVARIYVGGGIIEGSIPSFEWQETVNKAKTMLKVLS